MDREWAARRKAGPTSNPRSSTRSAWVWVGAAGWYETSAGSRHSSPYPMADRLGSHSADSLDPSEPGVKKKVHKGGSFLCTDQYCARYIAGGRGKGEPDTGTNHVGFRLVKSADAAAGPGR
ncbi:MAG: SUMF1/EgtB/PvdO family nonheme iron enzyme [Nitrospirota bacterium]